MRVLDKYTTISIVRSYVFILAIIAGLYLISDLFSTVSDILQTKPPLGVIFAYYLAMIPLIIVRISPFALLMSVLFVLGEQNRYNEILTMRASGISILRLVLPIIAIAAVISASVFFLQEKVLINNQKKVEDIKTQFVRKDFSGTKIERNLAFRSENYIFFVREYLPKEKTLHDVIIFKENENKTIAKRIFAKKIIFQNETWLGLDVTEYKLDFEGNIIGAPSRWKEKHIECNETPQELLFKKSMYADFYSLENLKHEMKRLRQIQATTLHNNLVVDFNHKIAEPFTHLFIVIGILPIALEIKKRKVALSSLGMGFLAGFLYYVATAICLALAKSGLLLPVLGAWVIPLFFLTSGVTALVSIK